MKMPITMTAKIAILYMLLMGLALANEPKKHGSNSQIAIQSAGLWHSSAHASTSGLHEALSAHYDYTTSRGLGFGVEWLFGASAGDLDRYMLQGMQDLMSVRPVGDINFLIGLDLYAGYHLIRRSYDKPLYLGTGLRQLYYSNVIVNTNYNAPLVAVYLPLELRGDLRVSPTIELEYLLAYDIPLDQATLIAAKQLPLNGGYGVRLHFGTRLYVSPRLYFFGTLVAEYYGFGHSPGVFVSIPEDTKQQGVKPGATATLSYPQSNLGYVGVRLGIGY